MATTNPRVITRENIPTYTTLEDAFLAANADSHYARQELKWLFGQAIDAIASDRNRVTRDELENAIQQMKSKEDRSLEDLIEELGFEVTEA